MAATASAPRSWLARPAVPLLAIAYAIAAVAAINASRQAALGYATVSVWGNVADLAAGLGLFAAGVVMWIDAGSRRLGALVMLAAAAWFAPDWEAWDHGPSLVRSLGTALAPLFLVLLFHLVLAAPRGRVHSRFGRATLVASYTVGLVVVLGRALFRDPFLDASCFRNCLDNVFLVHADHGFAQAIDRMWLSAAVGIGAVLVATAAWRLVAATVPARRALAPVLAPGAAAGVAEVAYALALLRTPLEDPRNSDLFSIFIVRSLAVAALAVGLLWAAVKARRLRANVAGLIAELGEAPPPGMLRQALAVAVGDPSLEVTYWLSESRRYIDANGKPVDTPAPRVGRAATPIERGGQRLAVVAHDSALLDGSSFEREIGSAARLAIENERLQAEMLAQVEDLRASRARIVERADEERRRLERDLHDGAQQRLLALSYDLRLARATAEAEGNPELAELLTSGENEAQATLAQLRDLAHGIYPAILAEAGLAAALATLADGAPVPVELDKVTVERYSVAVETAAYVAVAEAIDDACQRGATLVRVKAIRTGDRLVVTVRDDGVARSTPQVQLADRVGALGGALQLGPSALRAEIPCA